jgi:hypothetical protein
MSVSDAARTVDVPPVGRAALRAAGSLLAVAFIYAAHWCVTYVSALALVEGDQGFECWGRTVESGPELGFCRAAWGGWSAAMYLPELVLLAAGVAGLATRSFRVWKWGLAAAAVSVFVFFVVVSSTHFWAVNQMPVIWPDF